MKRRFDHGVFIGYSGRVSGMNGGWLLYGNQKDTGPWLSDKAYIFAYRRAEVQWLVSLAKETLVVGAGKISL